MKLSTYGKLKSTALKYKTQVPIFTDTEKHIQLPREKKKKTSCKILRRDEGLKVV